MTNGKKESLANQVFKMCLLRISLLYSDNVLQNHTAYSTTLSSQTDDKLTKTTKEVYTFRQGLILEKNTKIKAFFQNTTVIDPQLLQQMEPYWKLQLKCHPCSRFTFCPLQCSDTIDSQCCLKYTHTQRSLLLSLALDSLLTYIVKLGMCTHKFAALQCRVFRTRMPLQYL